MCNSTSKQKETVPLHAQSTWLANLDQKSKEDMEQFVAEALNHYESSAPTTADKFEAVKLDLSTKFQIADFQSEEFIKFVYLKRKISGHVIDVEIKYEEKEKHKEKKEHEKKESPHLFPASVVGTTETKVITTPRKRKPQRTTRNIDLILPKMDSAIWSKKKSSFSKVMK